MHKLEISQKKVLQKFLEQKTCSNCIQKIFKLNKQCVYTKTLEKFDKQTKNIKKQIHEKNLTDVKKMNQDVIHQKDTKIKVFLNIKLLNLMIAEIFSN